MESLHRDGSGNRAIFQRVLNDLFDGVETARGFGLAPFNEDGCLFGTAPINFLKRATDEAVGLGFMRQARP